MTIKFPYTGGIIRTAILWASYSDIISSMTAVIAVICCSKMMWHRSSVAYTTPRMRGDLKVLCGSEIGSLRESIMNHRDGVFSMEHLRDFYSIAGRFLAHERFLLENKYREEKRSLISADLSEHYITEILNSLYYEDDLLHHIKLSICCELGIKNSQIIVSENYWENKQKCFLQEIKDVVATNDVIETSKIYDEMGVTDPARNVRIDTIEALARVFMAKVDIRKSNLSRDTLNEIRNVACQDYLFVNLGNIGILWFKSLSPLEIRSLSMPN